MTRISKTVLKRIEEEKVHPYPKLRFILRRSFIATLFVISILLGSLASGVTIFQLTHADWDLYQHFTYSILEFAVLVVPYFWLVFMIGFTAIAIYFFRHTERGYRYSAIGLALVSIAVSVAGGFLFYKMGLSERLETVFQDRIPIYRTFQERRMKLWVAPERGLLAGKIAEIMSGKEFKLRDFRGNSWTIISGEDTLWRRGLKPTRNLQIKIIGRMQKKGLFVAKEIRPWHGRRFRHGTSCQGSPGSCNPRRRRNGPTKP